MSRRLTALLLALALLLGLGACGLSEPQEVGPLYTIYYLARERGAQGGDRIRACGQSLDVAEDAPLEEKAAAVVERLLAGPADGSMLSPVPAGVGLRSLQVRDQWAYVDLTEEFSQLGGVELSLASYCLTLSLTALEGVDAVTVTAQGRPLVQQPKPVLFERDVLLSTMDDVLQTVEVFLYFPTAGGQLVGEKHTLEVYEGQTLAENLVAALMEGPEDRELLPALPENFVVNAIRVESGVCYLNLSAASLAALPEDEASQRRILRSLADSLYSIKTIRELRLLADGKELVRFGSIPVEEVAVRN